MGPRNIAEQGFLVRYLDASRLTGVTIYRLRCDVRDTRIGALVISLVPESVHPLLRRLVSDCVRVGIPVLVNAPAVHAEECVREIPILSEALCVSSHMCRYGGCNRLNVHSYIFNIMSDDVSRLGLKCPGKRSRDGHTPHVLAPRPNELVPRKFQRAVAFSVLSVLRALYLSV